MDVVLGDAGGSRCRCYEKFKGCVPRNAWETVCSYFGSFSLTLAVLGGEALESTEPLPLKELRSAGDSEHHSQETTEKPSKRFKMQRLLLYGIIFLICLTSLMPRVCGCNTKLRKPIRGNPCAGRDCQKGGYCGYGPCTGCDGSHSWCHGYCTLQ
ncbi:hypothetical protein V5799_033560 [Amblyomma americanum]|uniref:Uncharacterized protein n=1 Tax=Amblyomma americanum TaxID=6943 RepID=A0AAQ4DMZ1_AMBAM